MAPMLDLQVWIGAVPVFPIRQALTASVSAASARPSAGTPGADALPWIGWHGGADRQDDKYPPGGRFRQPPAPIPSSVPPPPRPPKPKPSGGRAKPRRPFTAPRRRPLRFAVRDAESP